VPRPRPTPSTRRCACLAEIRGQMTEDRPDAAARSTKVPSETPFCSPFSVTCSLEREHRPCRCSRIGSTYPCPGPISSRDSSRNDHRTCFTVTTRFTISENRGQRAEDRPDGPSRPFSVITHGPNARRRPGAPAPRTDPRGQAL